MDDSPQISAAETKGSQSLGSVDVAIPPPPKAPYANVELVEALDGIAASTPRSFGAANLGTLFNGMYRDAMTEQKALRETNDKLRDELAKERQENARLSERVSSLQGLKWGKALFVAAGGLCIAVGYKFVGGPYNAVGWLILAAGVVVNVGCWMIDGLKRAK